MLVKSRAATTPGAALWLALVAVAAAVAGLLAGAARVRAIDADAYLASPGSRVALRGYVTAVPRRSDGLVRVRVETARGRLEVDAPEPVPDLPLGAEIRASGTIEAPPPWLRGNLRLHGVVRVLRAPRIELTGDGRGGIEGRVDAIRSRAEAALGRGMPEAQSALARGFVLGEDDRISPETVADFQRSGLAHHLAVSGENVVLLALLATPLLAALGIPLHARLAWLLALIALYVPLAGGGASIQRAGAMGAAAIVATLAGRPASRLYALLLAAAATLALNPRATSDVGWQLSFAAVAGIFAFGSPLRELLLARLGSGAWRRALADGAAVTVAATLATAPLMAHHFGSLSATSLIANLLTLPAIAPAMWLGMIVAALGQIPGAPVEPLNWLNSLLLAYVGEVARWMASPRWALLALPMRSWASVLSAYAGLLAAALALRRWADGRRGMRAAARLRSRLVVRAAIAAAAAAAAAAILISLPAGGAGAGDEPPSGLRISVLDVGQGDAILIQPADGRPLLVDGGPAGDGLEAKLRDLGVDSLAAAVVTHDQSDHAGGIEELLGEIPVQRLVFSVLGPRLVGLARASGAAPTRVAEGSELRSGSLRLDVLWPPRELLAGPPPQDPNTESVVLLARWHRFRMLLTADAEAETVPIDPGPVDVLKVAHHGSDDPGLGGLLDRAAPGLAVISVGEDNPFGHPAPATIAALASHQVPVLRTDLVGTVTIEVGAAGRDVRRER
jgi:competence protein ComEC